MSTRAVFLDRDGTVIEDTSYVDDPSGVRLLPGVADAIRRLSDAQYLVVIVSNQSGVARGLFDEETLSAVHQRVEELLAERGATIDGAYYCPYLDGPEATVEKYRRDSDLRKPNPGMLLQAADELGIDLAQSWMIGDGSRDVEAGKRAGCRTIRLAAEPDPEATYTAPNLLRAADIVTKGSGGPNASKTPAASGLPPRNEKSTVQATNETVRMLERIHDQLERANRPKRQHDFSVLRLFGALLQMFAIVLAVLGAIKMADDLDAAASARFAVACFLQLASLTAFAVDRFR